MWWNGPTVPGRLAGPLATLRQMCLADHAIRAAWVGGSLARGIADDWSDIDLHVAVRDVAGFEAERWMARRFTLVLADRIPGMTDGYLFLTPEWVHIDLVVHPVDDLDQGDLPSRVLIDREAVLVDRPGGEISAGEPWYPAEQVRLFLYLMGNAVVVLRRGELLALSHGTAAMRDGLLVPLMLAENGIRKVDGAKRLARYLTSHQLTTLGNLPPNAVDETLLREGQRALAVDYLPRARALARRCGGEWPESLERAAVHLWRDELSIDLDPDGRRP